MICEYISPELVIGPRPSVASRLDNKEGAWIIRRLFPLSTSPIYRGKAIQGKRLAANNDDTTE